MQETATQVTHPIEQMIERLTVETVFGKPTTVADMTVIPVAEVGAGFGYGFGWGQSPGETVGAGEGGGGGGGAGGRARPVGFIRITPDGVTFQPINDETRIALAGIVMAAWVIFWISKTIRTCATACTTIFAGKQRKKPENA